MLIELLMLLIEVLVSLLVMKRVTFQLLTMMHQRVVLVAAQWIVKNLKLGLVKQKVKVALIVVMLTTFCVCTIMMKTVNKPVTLLVQQT